jgi:hypothetical protein
MLPIYPLRNRLRKMIELLRESLSELVLPPRIDAGIRVQFAQGGRLFKD